MGFVEFVGRKDSETKWGPHVVAVDMILGVLQTDGGFVLDTDLGVFHLGKERRDELVQRLTT